MIYFDKNTLRVLKTIKRSKESGITWGELQSKYGDVANFFLLENLTIEGYTVTQNENNEWVDFKLEASPVVVSYKFKQFCTPKGNELIEQRCFDFWKWTVPTLISVAALIVSLISVLIG